MMRNSRLWKKFLSVLMAVLLLPVAVLSTAAGGHEKAYADTGFLHPGMLFTKEDLDRIKQDAALKKTPQIYEWQNLQQNPLASLNYTTTYVPIVYRNDAVYGNTGNYNLYASASAALLHALQWYVTGNQAYADKAIEILNGWAYNLTSIQGHDAQLAASIYGYKLLNAAEIIRYSAAGWSDADIGKFSDMMTNVFYPLTQTYGQVNGGWANGNWDAVDIVFNMSFGIFTENREIYDEAVNYFKSGEGNGTVMHYIQNDEGQVQESGRDQGHTQGGLAALAEAAQIGWNQRAAAPNGADMYSYPDNTFRLLKGIEYTAKYNLGYDVPYTPIPGVGYTLEDMSKGYSWIPGLVISPKGRGGFAPIYHQIYNMYVGDIGLPDSMLPYTKQVIARQPSTAFGLDFPSYGGLLFNDKDTPHSGQWGKTENITIINRGTGYTGIVVLDDHTPISVDPTFTTAADATVRGGAYANNNYGADATMTTKLSSADFTRESYLKFDLSGYAGSRVGSAKVRLYAASVGANVGTTEADYVEDDSWTESGITWNTKPASGTVLATWAKPAAGSYVEFDVTDQLNAELAKSGDKKLSIRLQTLASGDGVDYGTKEATAAGNRPLLVIQNEPMSYRFALEYLGTSNLYAYRSLANNKYLTVMPDGTLTASSDTIGTAQTFEYSNNGSGNLMKSVLNGKYVTFDPAAGVLKASATGVNNDYGRFDYPTPMDPPVTTAALSDAAPDGKNGWYVHPVTLTLTAESGELPVANTVYSLDEGQTWQTYTGPIPFNQDGKYSVWYESRDTGGGVEFARNITFNVDKTAPAIAIIGVSGGTIGDAGNMTPAITVTDNLSGVDSGKTAVTLDTYAIQPGTAIPLYTLPLGSHTLTVTASDMAGNESTQTVTFRITTSIDTLKALVTRFRNAGWIDSDGLAAGLRSQLDAGDLPDFLSLVKGQSGKHITGEAASYLLRDAQYLLSQQ